MKKIYSFILTLFFLFIATTAFAENPRVFRTALSGENIVPRVDTHMSGRFEMKLNDSDTKAHFNLHARHAKKVISASIYCGERGKNGYKVVVLMGKAPGGFDVDGKVAGFTITDANILHSASQCTDPIYTIKDMARAARSGKLYVQIETAQYIDGHVRGQIE